MKNTLLKFDTEQVEFDGLGDSNLKYVHDYFSRKITIFDIFGDVEDMLTIYQMQNNDKLERISYELYGTTDYWDILLMLNDKNPLFETAFDEDLIQQATADTINYYRNYIYFGSLVQSRVDQLVEEYLDRNHDENEKNRYIYVIKPSRINDFISMIKAEGYL